VAHTKSGLVSLAASLVECTGLYATYYSDTDLNPSAAVKASSVPGVDFSALANAAPAGSSLPSHSQYSVRWAGMLRPLHAATYTFFATRKAAGERVKIWVDNTLLIDAWSSVGEALDVAGTLSFEEQAEGLLYELAVEYQAGTSGNRGLDVEWLAAAGGRLTPYLCRAHRLQSFPMEILPGNPAASTSILQRCDTDPELVVAAGHQVCLELLLRDLWNNAAPPNMSALEVSGRDAFLRRIKLDDFVEMESKLGQGDGGVFLMFPITASGRFSTHVTIAGNHVVASPMSVQVTPGQPSPSSWRFSGDAISLSTAGVRSTFTVFSADEHGNAVSGAAVSFSGLYPLSPDAADARRADSSANATRTYQITGAAIQLDFVVTVSGTYRADLSFSGKALPGSPLHCRVLPSMIDAGASRLAGSGLTSKTAGVQSCFVISARDRFGNVVSNSGEDLDVSLRGSAPNTRDVKLPVVRRSQGEFVVRYRTIAAGLYTIRPFVVEMGGIHATYFSTGDLSPSAALKASDLSTIDFSTRAYLPPPASSVPPNSSYSIRWAGMLRPPPSTNYTMFATRRAAEERVKVWVDNMLVIDMWNSLGGSHEASAAMTFAEDVAGPYRDVRVEYAANASAQGSRGLTLQWQAANSSKTIVPAAALGRAQAIEPEHPTLTTMTQRFCASTSSISGSGLTLLTAGVAASLTIRSRDEFGNLRVDDEILLGTSRNTASGIALMTVSGSYTAGINLSGLSLTRYTNMVPGGLGATYYSDRALGQAVSTRAFVAIGQGVGDISSYAGIRWSGYLSPTLSDVYSFHLLASSFAEVSLYDTAHERLLSVQSSTGGADAITGARYLSSGQLYLIDVIYWHVTGDARLQLQVGW